MFKGKNYCVTKENVIAHELIGLDAKVVSGSSESRMGIKGNVVDETKNVLEIETKDGVKKVPKREAVFEFDLAGEKVEVDGKILDVRPEDRIKESWRKYHGKLQRC